MSKIIAFALALSVSATVPTGYAFAAEPIEIAIADMVAAIGSIPGVSARYDGLTYDPATDTARISGLTIIEATTGAEIIAFQPITVVGYAENPDGTFGAESLTTDGATVASELITATIADVKLEGLGNVPKKLGSDKILDPKRPFTSMIRAAAPLVDIRLDHGEVGTVAIIDKTSGVPTATAYQDLVVDGWADGRIASSTFGPTKVSATTADGGFTMSIGGVDAQGMDYAAIWRVYDPDQYVAGVGDRIWRDAVETIAYRDISFEAPGGRFTAGSMSIENLSARQPERSFAPFFDEAMLHPDMNREPTPEELRTLLGFFSAFSLGRMSFRDMDFAADDGTHGRLGNITLADLSSEGLGEFSIEGFELTPRAAGSLKLGRIAFGGVVFPNLADLIEAGRAEDAGEPVDYSKITLRLGSAEMLDLDANLFNSPHIQLAKARLDLGDYIGPIPTAIALDIAGLKMPASAIPDPIARAAWQVMGYDSIEAGASLKLAWNENDGSVVVDDFQLNAPEVGTLSLDAVLGKIDRKAIENVIEFPEAVQKLALIGGTLTFTDDSITDRAIEMQAATLGARPDAVRRQIAASIPVMLGPIGNATMQEQLAAALELFVMSPGSIIARVAPPVPVPLVALAAFAQTAPASLPELLGLTVESTGP